MLKSQRQRGKENFTKLFDSESKYEALFRFNHKFIAFDARRKILELHLQNQASKACITQSRKSSDPKWDETPKDQTIHDIVNNLGDESINLDSSLVTFELYGDQKLSIEKEIRLDQSFLRESEIHDKDTQGSSYGQQRKESQDTIKTSHKTEQCIDPIMPQGIPKSSLSLEKFKFMVIMYQIYTMSHKNNPFDFSALLKVWSACSQQKKI